MHSLSAVQEAGELGEMAARAKGVRVLGSGQPASVGK